MGVVGGKFDLFTKDEIQEEMSKKLAAGEIDEDDAQGAARMFDMIIEFTDNHEIVTWMKMPEDLSEEQIKAALDSGEIFEIKDGLAAVEKKGWKAPTANIIMIPANTQRYTVKSSLPGKNSSATIAAVLLHRTSEIYITCYSRSS